MTRHHLIPIALAFLGLPLLRAQVTPPESARTLDSWVDDLRSDDPAVRGRAAMALEELGPAAAPAAPRLLGILRELKGAPPPASATAIDRLFGDAGRIPAGRPGAALEAARRLGQVVRVLGALGPEVPETVPALTEALRECLRRAVAPSGRLDAATEDLAGDCADALGRLGPAAASAVPVLLEALACDAPRLRARVIDALKMMPLDATSLLEECVRRLAGSGSVASRTGGAWALSALGPAAEPAVPALVAALRSDAAPLRQAAAAALGAVGPAAGAAIPDLVAAVRAGDLREDGAREAAAAALRALAGLDAASPEALDAVVQAAERRETRETAVEVLARFAGLHESARDRLVAEARVSGAVFAELLRQDPKSREFPHLQASSPPEPRPPAELEKLLDPGDDPARRAAAWKAVLEVAAHGAAAAETAPALRALLAGEERLALLAAYAFGRIGRPAAPGVVAGVSALAQRIGGRGAPATAGAAGGQLERTRLLTWVLEVLGALPVAPVAGTGPALRPSGAFPSRPGAAPVPGAGVDAAAAGPAGVPAGAPVLTVDPSLRVNDNWLVRPRQAPRSFRVVPLVSGGVRVEIDDEPHHLVLLLRRTAAAAPSIDFEISTTDPSRPGAPISWRDVQGRVTTRNGVWIDRGPIEIQFDVTGTVADRRLRLEGGVVVDTTFIR